MWTKSSNKRGSKKGKKIKQKNRTQNKLDLEIPKLNHQAFVNIYISWGEEVRKEGRQRGYN